jgi:flagellar hook-length control protein FliK
MNTNLLAIDNMLAAIAGPGSASSKPPEARNTEHFSPTPTDNSPLTDAPETAMTDNAPIGAQGRPADKPPQEFSHTLREEIATEVSQKTEDSTKSEEQSLNPSVAKQPNLVDLWLAQYSQGAEHGGEGGTTIVQPKAASELAQMLADLRAGGLPSGAGKTAKSAGDKLLLTVDQSQVGPKVVSPDTCEGLLVTDTQSDEGKGAEGIQISNKTFLATKELTNQQGGKGSLSGTFVDAGSKTATADEKPVIALVSDASGSQETPPSTGKKFTPEALVGADGKTAIADEKPAMADKPAVSDGQKTPVLSTGFPQADGESPDSHQNVTVGPKKSALVAEEPAGSKTVAGQVLSESSGSGGKGQAYNLSGDSSLQKLNVTELQVSTGQAKDTSSSTSNNSPNSDFEQALPANGVQSPITELSLDASTQTARIADNTSPGGPSTSIGEQILESIHSSLRQGEQQVTIRLNPPELGRGFIKFQEQQDQITGLLEVSRAQTRYEIEQALPQIIRTLENAGIQIKRLEVVLTDQPEHQPFRDQSLQDGSFQQHSFAEGGNPDNKSADEWLTDGYTHQDIPEPQLLVTNDSINVLV